MKYCLYWNKLSSSFIFNTIVESICPPKYRRFMDSTTARKNRSFSWHLQTTTAKQTSLNANTACTPAHSHKQLMPSPVSLLVEEQLMLSSQQSLDSVSTTFYNPYVRILQLLLMWTAWESWWRVTRLRCLQMIYQKQGGKNKRRSLTSYLSANRNATRANIRDQFSVTIKLWPSFFSYLFSLALLLMEIAFKICISLVRKEISVFRIIWTEPLMFWNAFTQLVWNTSLQIYQLRSSVVI